MTTPEQTETDAFSDVPSEFKVDAITADPLPWLIRNLRQRQASQHSSIEIGDKHTVTVQGPDAFPATHPVAD
ncbi:hypothetical protein [Rubripirellula reticaptiva]|uniref:Uncharacterized protein n=1 Tax=Rubripirellula reticaptiva TaxID=2528013 RepID=A0A5C6EH54_9BACT|nr:hypothetical protein [Rubripirellula reticaptiva]TWU49153.1 hypothetical protein Poly59_37670 [Rubripirellula reticaptiva]